MTETTVLDAVVRDAKRVSSLARAARDAEDAIEAIRAAAWYDGWLAALEGVLACTTMTATDEARIRRQVDALRRALADRPPDPRRRAA